MVDDVGSLGDDDLTLRELASVCPRCELIPGDPANAKPIRCITCFSCARKELRVMGQDLCAVCREIFPLGGTHICTGEVAKTSP